MHFSITIQVLRKCIEKGFLRCVFNRSLPEVTGINSLNEKKDTGFIIHGKSFCYYTGI